jgi:tripartite-type tricarboxylate transporter receptor subunit TctC
MSASHPLQRAIVIATMALLGAMPLVARAQATSQAQPAYPSRTVRIVVPFLAGGAIDVLARLLSQHLSSRLNQQFIVDNRAGAGGTIGADLVAKAPADGYTLLLTAQGPLVINPFIMKRLPYDARTAFAPITVVVEAPNVLTTRPATPFRTPREFFDYANTNAGKVTFASQGIGTTGHITGATLTQRTGIALNHVPYKGFPPMFTDVVTGRVDFMFADTINVVSRIRSKELVAVAVAAKRRNPALPDVPTFEESGYPGIVFGPWFSLLAPAGTPVELRNRLATEIRDIVAIPELANQLKDMGLEIRASTPQEFERFLDAEYQRWGDVIRASGITVNE